MSSRGRRRQGPGLAPRPGPSQGQEPAGPSPVGPSPVGPSQLGWALLVIAAALIGGLAAAALVHTSLTIAVIVSVVAGGIAVLAAFRSPARPPELRAGVPSQSPQSPQAPQLPQAPSRPRPASLPGLTLSPRAPRPSLPLFSLHRAPTRPSRYRPKPTGRPAAARPPGTRPWSSCCRFRRSRETRSRRTRPGGTRLRERRPRRVRAPSGCPLRTCPPTWRRRLSRSARAAARSGSTSGRPAVPGISCVRPAGTPGPGSLVHRGRRFGSCPGGEGSDMRSQPPAP